MSEIGERLQQWFGFLSRTLDKTSGGRNADDLYLLDVAWAESTYQAFANGIAVGKVFARKGLVNERRSRQCLVAGLDVVPIEFAPGQQRNPHGFQIARADALRRHPERRIRRVGTAQVVLAVGEVEGHIPGPRHPFDSGRRSTLAVDPFAQRDGIYLGVRRRQIKLQRMDGIEARIE